MNFSPTFLASRALRCAVLLAIPVVIPSAASAQWATTYEQFYLPGKFNWAFRHNYPAADRLFNAFDYGHAILYERLWTAAGAPVSLLEEKEYNFITRELLVHPPRVPLEEAAIEVEYAKLAPEAKQMFDWAHLLHRQIYDVWADERLSAPEKDATVQELLRYYKTRKDLAFSSQPKTMELMEGQPYSTAFRHTYPKFNGLIWAYHWLQVGLYEPLVVGTNVDERQRGILAAVARFRQMIESPPTWMPRVMPMTAAVAPVFAARYPEAAIIFDNLHSMHDVISDILANPKVPRARKRAEIMIAARRYRDDTSYVQTEAEWREMTAMMGVQNMGGPAVGFLAAFPTPTVERGAVMAGMDHGKMNMGAARTDTTMAGMDHSKMNMPAARTDTAMATMDHSKMNMPPTRTDTAMAAMDHSKMAMPAESASGMMEMHMRMMADPVIRARMMADTGMRRMMRDMMASMPAEHRAQMEAAMRADTPVPVARTPTAARTPKKKPAVKAQAPVKKAEPKKAEPTKADPMKGMDHSKMKMP